MGNGEAGAAPSIQAETAAEVESQSKETAVSSSTADPSGRATESTKCTESLLEELLAAVRLRRLEPHEECVLGNVLVTHPASCLAQPALHHAVIFMCQARAPVGLAHGCDAADATAAADQAAAATIVAAAIAMALVAVER